MKNFELVQVHLTSDGEAEVVIRDKNSFLAFSGNLKEMKNPKSVYPPDYKLGVIEPGFYEFKITEKE